MVVEAERLLAVKEVKSFPTEMLLVLSLLKSNALPSLLVRVMAAMSLPAVMFVAAAAASLRAVPSDTTVSAPMSLPALIWTAFTPIPPAALVAPTLIVPMSLSAVAVKPWIPFVAPV